MAFGTSAALLPGAAALALVVLAGAAGAGRATTTIRVRDDVQFQAAVSALRDSGGTILLRPSVYRELTVPPRSARRLRILGMPGVRVERVLFDRTQGVTLGRVTVSPRTEDAVVEVRGSQDIELHDLRVTAQGTRRSASVFVPDSRHVTIRRSELTHCGDRSPEWSNCLLLYRWSRQITVEDSWFHDCYGCDFIHGRFGSDLTMRRNRFERALPCRIGRVRCMHQDLIELFAGKRLRVEGNHFGVYKFGGAQLYITGPVDDVVIANNVFRGTDPRVPGYRSRIALVIGAKGSDHLPRFVRVVNNTILTGAARNDGYAGSLRMSRAYRYGGYPRRERPLVVNNVIGLLQTHDRVCTASRASISNVVLRGHACSPSDSVGLANLDWRGRPTAGSWLLIDTASRRHAPKRDIKGRHRVGAPDIGAYEYGAG